MDFGSLQRRIDELQKGLPPSRPGRPYGTLDPRVQARENKKLELRERQQAWREKQVELDARRVAVQEELLRECRKLNETFDGVRELLLTLTIVLGANAAKDVVQKLT